MLNFIKKIRQSYGDISFSKKFMWIFMAFFLMLLVLINVVVWRKISFALYYPAEATINYSIDSIKKTLKKIGDYPENIKRDDIRDPLVSGVVLRVFDSRNNLIVDTDRNYPANSLIEQNILEDPPYLLKNGMEIAKIGNALIYREKITYEKFGEEYTFYFYRTITSMSDVLDELQIFMLAIDILFIIFAIIINYFVDKKFLRPVKNMTELANKIAFESKSDLIRERIPFKENAEDELTKLAKTFNAMLDRMQGDISKQKKFVSEASHELKTPLTVIEGYVEILEKFGEEDHSLLDESVEAIRSEAQNMKHLIENLLFLARSDQNTLHYNKATVNLKDIVDKAFQRMMVYEKDHTVTLIKNEHAQIYADESMILQMLRIILDNAAKYTPKGKKIDISSIVENNMAIVQISDYGIGIAPEDINVIFERGFRVAENDLVKNVKGCGIGLSIAKMIADSHNIKIDIDSKLGEGTTFTLNIPISI